MGALSNKRRRFVDEYIIDLNATQAAIRTGYSEKTAYSQGQRLLKNVEVAAVVSEAIEARAKRTEFTADDVVRELVSIVKGEDCKAKTADRVKSLDLLGKNLGMFNKLILTGDPDTPLVLDISTAPDLAKEVLGIMGEVGALEIGEGTSH